MLDELLQRCQACGVGGQVTCNNSIQHLSRAEIIHFHFPPAVLITASQCDKEFTLAAHISRKGLQIDFAAVQ